MIFFAVYYPLLTSNSSLSFNMHSECIFKGSLVRFLMTVRMLPVQAVVSEAAHKILKQILHDLASVFVYVWRSIQVEGS